MSLGSDFRRLWGAYAISEFGSAISLGALPLIATLVLHASVLQVSLLAALGGVAGAVLAVPLGPWIEFHRKRPVMISADLIRCGALLSVPIAAATGVLSYPQLCLVAVAQSAGVIAFNSASGAHLKALVPAAGRADANGKFEATFWTAYSAGPALGGVLVSWLGATTTLAADGVSFLLSALGIRRLRAPEPTPPPRTGETHRLAEITAGWRYILGHRELRMLFWNSQVFGGCVMASAPLVAVLMLRDLHFPPWQYGLALGVPCIGGVLGALAVRPLTRRYGARRMLLGFGAARTIWLAGYPLAPAGALGLAVITGSQFLLLICAGAFNPTFATHRMTATEDGYMSRVLAAWSISSRVGQPVFILAGGLVAAATSTRTALIILSVALLTSNILLPWRAPTRAEPVPAGPTVGM